MGHQKKNRLNWTTLTVKKLEESLNGWTRKLYKILLPLVVRYHKNANKMKMLNVTFAALDDFSIFLIKVYLDFA